MNISRFSHCLQSTAEISEIIGQPSELVLRKQLSELDKHMRTFIAESPFMLLSTVGADGGCDVSPRGDSPAVALVLDSKSLVIPDRPGNRRADSLNNILNTGQVGLLFLVPGMGETLRVNGRACVTQDPQILGQLASRDKRPPLAIGVEVEEAYFQCAKAIYRSNLWQGCEQHPNATPEHYAQVLIDQTGIKDESAQALGEKIRTSYQERLY